MKASGSDPETFRSEFSTSVFAAHTRFWLILQACLLLAAQAIAAQAPTVTIDGPSQVTAFSAVITGTVISEKCVSNGAG